MSSLLDGIHVHATVNVYLASQPEVAEIQQSLRTITGTVTALQKQGVRLMTQSQENADLLAQLNDYTNRLAAAGEQQAAVSQEIASDIDTLIAQSTDTATTEGLRALRDKNAIVVAGQEAFVQTLKNIAAKNDEPLPPPVEPAVEPVG